MKMHFNSLLSFRLSTPVWQPWRSATEEAESTAKQSQPGLWLSLGSRLKTFVDVFVFVFRRFRSEEERPLLASLNEKLDALEGDTFRGVDERFDDSHSRPIFLISAASMSTSLHGHSRGAAVISLVPLNYLWMAKSTLFLRRIFRFIP